MWLKRTRVNTGKKSYCYIQLVHSYHENGRNCHEVVVNLGREGSFDLSIAKSLVAHLNSGNDSLPSNEIALLSKKLYGPLYLLQNAFVQSRMHQLFCSMPAFSNITPEQISNAVFFIVSYFLLNNSGQMNLLTWVENCFLPWGIAPSAQDMKAALSILNRPNLIYKTILQSPGDWKEPAFCFRCMAGLIYPNRRKKLLPIDISCTHRFYPLQVSPAKSYSDYSRKDHILMIAGGDVPDQPAGNPELLFLCRLEKENSFVNRADVEQTPRITWENGFYQVMQYGSYKVFILYPIGSKEDTSIYEMFLTNSSLDEKLLCQCFYQWSSYQERFYQMIIPPDLHQLWGHNRYQNVISNILHIMLLLSDKLEKEYADWALTAEELLNIMSSVYLAELNIRGKKHRYHTQFTQQQTRLIMKEPPE